MKIVADPNIPYVSEAFGPLGDVQLVPGRQIGPEVVREADALLVRSVTPVNPALLAGSTVRFVATATIGFDHIDREYLSRQGIGFASAQGSNANSVAEYITAGMLELGSRHNFRVRDKVLGVVGVGNVGSRVVRYAEALGMRVLQNDPPRERAEYTAISSPQPSPPRGAGARRSAFVSLDEVVSRADIITLHVPLTREGEDATFHLFDKERLDALEARKPVLFNSSRGAVVDNKALLKAIDGERLGCVGLDVWENEPNILAELLDVVDIGTPHIAGYSFDGKVNGSRMIYEALCGFFRLTPKWVPTLPPPLVPRIEHRVEDADNEEETLRQVIRQVYDINRDDAALRKSVRQFDKLRADYPVRREFFNTELVLRGAGKELRAKFAALGFKLV
ncbi:MAG TPA: 4-phosphoerythronate dehydrogenase [Verrucomicrobiae bacterium]|nr:4-phosphoerythronate dehydrogenase [Verrucomicrobiae bacterium]